MDESKGLASTFVTSMVIDEHDILWAGTDKVLSSLILNKTSVSEHEPTSFFLIANYLNPFNPSTTISFTLPVLGKASLIVYDIMGRKVRELVSGQVSAGVRTVLWDGRDDSGRSVSSGVYIARLTMGKHTAVRKMLLMK